VESWVRLIFIEASEKPFEGLFIGVKKKILEEK